MRIQKLMLLLVSVLPVLCHAQKFELKQPDIKKIVAAVKASEYTNDEMLIYLKQNYKTAEKPTGVKKDVEFENQPICSFKQKFEGGIEYFIDSCGESKGTNVLLTLPKTDTATLKKWIEKMYKVNGTEIKNVWDGLIYRPEDEGAGCYYEIKQSKNKTVVEMYCGC
ncbi:hypothetical protein AAEO56_01855 [Flavobacterium sp. DGU11]|uniref:Uncharacterized protein n=1 Tax=Flavobacterium arundinis TaxID=3139143 RepID=A0ABU9HTF3_9FLAO